ncbi:MAG: MATE family efflux transporter [Lacibacter sp.]|jgi:putative MATE family efflux protein
MGQSLKLQVSYRSILALSLPISFSLLIPFLNFTTNNYFISHLGEKEMGIAGITGVYFLIMAIIGNGFNSALQAIVSRKAGEEQPEAIGTIVMQGMRLLLLFSLAGILITLWIGPFIFSKVLHDSEVQKQAVSFLKIRIWGLPFLYLFQLGNAFLVGTTNARFLFIGSLFEAGSNILLDYGLIFGHWGLPQLGFNGAAWASVIAECIGMFVVLILIRVKQLHRQFYLFRSFHFDSKRTLLLLNASAPLIAQYLISIVSWFVFYVFIEHHGQRALAISNVMRNIFSLTGIFTWAFASTANTMVSNIIGQGRSDDVLFLINKIVRLSTGAACMLFILFNLFPYNILSFFQLSSDFIAEAIPVLRMVTVGMLFMSFAVVWLNAVTGTGNTSVNLRIEFVTILAYLIYISLVLEYFRLSILWAWASEIVYWNLIFILSYLYLKSGKWKGKSFDAG